ncbi:MAG: 1-deoxy-D-xylulose-5-phosphate synthase N-terminal domain-containing protein [Planctomycetaceae bacterium]
MIDFEKDRLIWDTGHQIYPHKLITGRFPRFRTISGTKGADGISEPRRVPTICS